MRTRPSRVAPARAEHATHTRRIAVLVPLALALVACGDTDGGDSDQSVPFPTEQWTVVDPAEMDMDVAELNAALDYAFQPDMNTQGVVIVRGGAIVAERYAEGRDKDSPATSWSAAKSFTSALIGIARDEGLINDVEQPMSDFLAPWEGTEKGKMALRSVLMMQSGLDYKEDYSDTNSEMVELASAENANEYAMTLMPAYEPDERWYYSSGDTQLLSAVLESVTGMTARDYARDRLFSRIGMNNTTWWNDPSGHTMTYCCVDSTTREFAKFGLLFLRNGKWDGEQVVSEDWVRESTTTLSSFEGYAYQWWTAGANTSVEFPDDLYYAAGLDTQRIIVVPSLDLVIAKNTLYDQPPNAPDATGSLGFGWLLDVQPRGGSATDAIVPGLSSIVAGKTYAPLLWEDSVFVSHIINSIEGSKKLPTEPSVTPGQSPDDPQMCRQAAMDGFGSGSYCEEVHGCACDDCAQKFLDCEQVPECVAIVACAFEAQCYGIGCLIPCYDTIQENGGVDGAGVQLALSCSECADTCPLSCP